MSKEDLLNEATAEPEEKRNDADGREPVPEWTEEEGEQIYSEGTQRLLVMPQRDLVVFNEMVSAFEVREDTMIEEIKSVMMHRAIE